MLKKRSDNIIQFTKSYSLTKSEIKKSVSNDKMFLVYITYTQQS